jgi:hypothetical protein
MKPLRPAVKAGTDRLRANETKTETSPLSRVGRKVAEAALAAAQFKATSDGRSAIRQFEVHGMAVTEMVNAADAIPPNASAKAATPSAGGSNRELKDSAPQTAPLSRQGRKVADATLAAAKFKPTGDGKRLARQFEVHGMAVTEFVSADRSEDGGKEEK